jgi:hypothetical protein
MASSSVPNASGPQPWWSQDRTQRYLADQMEHLDLMFPPAVQPVEPESEQARLIREYMVPVQTQMEALFAFETWFPEGYNTVAAFMKEAHGWFDFWYGAKMIFVPETATATQSHAIADRARRAGIQHVISNAGHIEDGTIVVYDTAAEFDVDDLTPPDLIDDTPEPKPMPRNGGWHFTLQDLANLAAAQFAREQAEAEAEAEAYAAYANANLDADPTPSTQIIDQLPVDNATLAPAPTPTPTPTPAPTRPFVFNPNVPAFIPASRATSATAQEVTSQQSSSSSMDREIERELCAVAAERRLQGAKQGGSQ